VEPDSLVFGKEYIGGSKELAFTIANIGGGTLSGSISESCLHYRIVSGGGTYNLAGGDSVVAVVRFEPAAEGTLTCEIDTGQEICADVWLKGVVGPEPYCLSVTDVANDQGRQVRIDFLKSARERAGSPTPILQYEAYRRVDSLPPPPSVPESANGALDLETRLRRAREAGMLSDPAILMMGWDYAGAIPAHGEAEYNMIAPTLADSTVTSGMHWSVYFIRAATAVPTTFFDSPIDSGYSIDNLAPGIPQGFVAAYNTGVGNQLSWDACQDEDFRYFDIYRSTDPEFMPAPEDLVHTTTGVTWLDPVSEGYRYSYKITAVDFSGNESDPVSPGAVTSVAESQIPTAFELYQNVPNPFNPTTAIRFDVPTGGGEVKLKIYDVGGRLVKTLADGPQSPGRKTITWDGRNAEGYRVATGLYFYSMEAPGFRKTRKMVLLQ
jgi:hypothetical protein